MTIDYKGLWRHYIEERISMHFTWYMHIGKMIDLYLHIYTYYGCHAPE